MPRKTKGGTTRADVLQRVSHMVESEWERATDRLIEREPDFGGFSPGWENVLDQRSAAKREIAYIVLKGLGKTPPFAPGLAPLAKAVLDVAYPAWRKHPDFGHMVPTKKTYRVPVLGPVVDACFDTGRQLDGKYPDFAQMVRENAEYRDVVHEGREWRAPAAQVRGLHLCLIAAWQAARAERDPALRLEAAIRAADAERTRQRRDWGIPPRNPGVWPEEMASKWPIVLRDGKLVTDRMWRTPPLLPLLEKIAEDPGRWNKAQLISLVREVRPGSGAVNVKSEGGRPTEALRMMETETVPLVLAIKRNVRLVSEALFRAAVPVSPRRGRG